jgi:hypothetical protein
MLETSPDSCLGLGLSTGEDFRNAVQGLPNDLLLTRDLRVYLSRNAIRELSPSVLLWLSGGGNSNNITHLDLSCNLLTAFPSEVVQLKVGFRVTIVPVFLCAHDDATHVSIRSA